MMHDRDGCIFCRIADKKVKAFVVHEDEHILAFLDIHPRVEGHTLVIPKIHAETLLDLPSGEINPLFLGVRKVSEILLSAFKTKTLTVGINHGDVEGEKWVPHLHVHLLPRSLRDGGGSIQTVVHVEDQRPIEDMHALIIKTLKNNLPRNQKAAGE